MNNRNIEQKRLLDSIASKFETAWKQSRTSIEQFLDENPSDVQSDQLLMELIPLEIELRLENGERVSADEYFNRFGSLEVDWLNEIFNSKTMQRVAGEDTQSIHSPSAASSVDFSTLDSGNPRRQQMLPTTRTIGDYEIISEIARGGMGVVYKARQKSLNRIVALKMILSGQLAGAEEIKRFESEAEAAANLDHPGIVPIYEIGEHEGHPYFSMGFVEGESLAAKTSQGPLQPGEAAELVMTISKAITFAHEHGVVHRDLKPANVLIDAKGQPKVTDFGLAKRLEGDSNLTGTGQILGTPSYMPPEQASGDTTNVDERADVYALGAILYNLLTGRPPFQAASPVDTLRQVMENDPVAPRNFDANIPKDLETICIKCLEKSSIQRYATAHEVEAELRRFLANEPIAARPISSIAKAIRWCKRKPMAASTLAVSTLTIIVLITVVPWIYFDQIRLTELNREKSELSQQRDQLSKQKVQLESDREKLQGEKNFLENDRERLLQEQGLLKNKQIKLEEDNKSFAAANEKLKSDRDVLTRDKMDFAKERDRFAKQNADAQYQIQRIKSELKQKRIDAKFVNESIWNRVKTAPEKNEDQVGDFDLAIMRVAVQSAPTGMHFNTLAAAEFRAGNYEKSIEAAKKSIELLPDELKLDGPHPIDLALLTMCNFKKGNVEVANDYRGKLIERMKQKRFQNDDECKSFVTEVNGMYKSE